MDVAFYFKLGFGRDVGLSLDLCFGGGGSVFLKLRGFFGGGGGVGVGGVGGFTLNS